MVQRLRSALQWQNHTFFHNFILNAKHEQGNLFQDTLFVFFIPILQRA